MTKEELIKQMSTEELANFLREMSENRIVQYADLEEWLLDDEGAPITSYCGKPGKYSTQSEFLKSSGGIPEVRPCRLLGPRSMFGKPYYSIIDLTNGNVMSVPVANIIRE
ncbi:MAG: hypothetical protein K6G84_08675 [Lachnospiraceae bacterium]|nr:hypothetical protein [Lachnospiraceae bacterium]